MLPTQFVKILPNGAMAFIPRPRDVVGGFPEDLSFTPVALPEMVVVAHAMKANAQLRHWHLDSEGVSTTYEKFQIKAAQATLAVWL